MVGSKLIPSKQGCSFKAFFIWAICLLSSLIWAWSSTMALFISCACLEHFRYWPWLVVVCKVKIGEKNKNGGSMGVLEAVRARKQWKRGHSCAQDWGLCQSFGIGNRRTGKQHGHVRQHRVVVPNLYLGILLKGSMCSFKDVFRLGIMFRL